MFKEHQVGAVLLMGGTGDRFGNPIPKQFALLEGKPLYRYALQTFLDCGFFDQIIVVCHEDWIEKVEERDLGITVVKGGKTRQESSWKGLCAFSPNPDIILVHDAVRPFVTKEIIEENIQVAILQGAVDTCIPSADTIVFAEERKKISTIPLREQYLRGQTPQTFRTDWLLDAHKKAKEEGIVQASDDCQLLLRAGFPVSIVRGNEENMKITFDTDLVFAKTLLEMNYV